MEQETILIKGNIKQEDKALLQKELSSFYNEVNNIKIPVISEGQENLDSSIIALSENVISIIAAVLYLYLELRNITKPKLNDIDDIKALAKNIMAERKILDVKIIDIDNFRIRNDNKPYEPCVLTIQDKSTKLYYKVLFYKENKAKVINFEPPIS